MLTRKEDHGTERDHDSPMIADGHATAHGELMGAAAALLGYEIDQLDMDRLDDITSSMWPWLPEPFTPSRDRIVNLRMCRAFIDAEIARLGAPG